MVFGKLSILYWVATAIGGLLLHLRRPSRSRTSVRLGNCRLNLGLLSIAHEYSGQVISKLTDGRSTHIPYPDSKLTRLLQSSLSGHGRVSLICTVTPASSNTEETHNTLKFAQRSKHVEIEASQNKVLDEKSLIKKYQREISNLKQELQQLKRSMHVGETKFDCTKPRRSS